MAMFPLSCARVRMHTSREMSTHNKTWSAHKCSFQKCVLHIISYTSFQIQMSPGKMLHTRNFFCTQTLKIRGNIASECFSILKGFPQSVSHYMNIALKTGQHKNNLFFIISTDKLQ